MAAKARLSCAYFVESTRFYAEARDRILASFERLSAEWPRSGAKYVAFVGAGEVAEIGYICLRQTDLQLAGVLDESRVRPFLGMPVHRPSEWSALAKSCGTVPIFVPMSFEAPEDIQHRLDEVCIPRHQVFWL
ncbi:MAG TPA: hypothetical protein VMO26_03255 [Vicinamibacterales bacterium]|nr:hypothetical protein [Vicinamibacterales bacterium]